MKQQKQSRKQKGGAGFLDFLTGSPKRSPDIIKKELVEEETKVTQLKGELVKSEAEAAAAPNTNGTTPNANGTTTTTNANANGASTNANGAVPGAVQPPRTGLLGMGGFFGGVKKSKKTCGGKKSRSQKSKKSRGGKKSRSQKKR